MPHVRPPPWAISLLLLAALCMPTLAVADLGIPDAPEVAVLDCSSKVTTTDPMLFTVNDALWTIEETTTQAIRSEEVTPAQGDPERTRREREHAYTLHEGRAPYEHHDPGDSPGPR